MASPKARVEDRRIQKTRKLLHDALGSLIREKPYDSIAVQEILDRANVGRSTFYTHFRDKDELLVSGIHDLLNSVYPAATQSAENRCEAIIRFSLPVFEHIHGHLRAGARRMGPTGRAAVHQHLQRVLAELITEDIKRHLRPRRETTSSVPLDLLVQHVASTFILVLHWWLDTRSPLPPREIDKTFRALILPSLSANVD
jgi:AcrR family transcriptional regulator